MRIRNRPEAIRFCPFLEDNRGVGVPKKSRKKLRGEGLSSITSHLFRAVSSVVEHYLDTVGVTGSNPVSRTIPLPLRLSANFLGFENHVSAAMAWPAVQPVVQAA